MHDVMLPNDVIHDCTVKLGRNHVNVAALCTVLCYLVEDSAYSYYLRAIEAVLICQTHPCASINVAPVETPLSY